MDPIFLIGFMCSGKTTLGKAVCERSGIEFIDLDEAIELKAGRSVKDIFDNYGESEFRRMEMETLVDVADRKNVIVACGGGTPCQPGAMELMNSKGTTVRLVASEHRMVKRLLAGRRKRPLLANIDSYDEMKDFLIFTVAKREPFYSKSMCRFDSSLLDSQEEVEQSVEKFIAQFIDV